MVAACYSPSEELVQVTPAVTVIMLKLLRYVGQELKIGSDSFSGNSRKLPADDLDWKTPQSS